MKRCFDTTGGLCFVLPALILLAAFLPAACRKHGDFTAAKPSGVTASPQEVYPKAARDIRSYEPLTADEQRRLLAAARESLEMYCRCRSLPKVDGASASCPHLREKRGVFVTLEEDGMLRGCIGCFEAELPLYAIVPHMAVQSGFADPRFKPLRAEELSKLKIEISVYLSTIEPIQSLDEFVPGKHGIVLEKGDRRATFLPQVATEQGWDKETTLRHLSLKAGLPSNAWKDPDARFFIYETQVFREGG